MREDGPSTTTTTVPSGPCDGVPAAATFASISCRLIALRAHVNGEAGLGAFQSKLAQSVDKAAGKIDEAVTLCGG